MTAPAVADKKYSNHLFKTPLKYDFLNQRLIVIIYSLSFSSIIVKPTF